MDEKKPLLDPYDPESYPQEKRFIAQMKTYEDGFTDQWRLLAQHAVGGGDLCTAPYPELERFDPRFPRSAVEGIQQARRDAAEMQETAIYDAKGILETLRGEEEDKRRLVEARALVDGGDYAVPPDMTTARLHTTVTRLFSRNVVHDVTGFPYEPLHVQTKYLHLDGPGVILGLRELDLGMTLKGDYRVDVVDADSTCGGSGVLTLRMVWGDPSTIVGAVEAGRLGGVRRRVGIGSPGASRLMREEPHRIIYADDRLVLVEDEQCGWSAWFWSAEGRNGYSIFLAVDADLAPVGIILDSSGVADYYYFDDDHEACPSPWPENAQEFDPARDKPGNPPGFAPLP